MTKPVEFPTYEGQKNYPTWVTMLVIDNEQKPYTYYRKLAKEGKEAIKDDIITGMKHIMNGHGARPHDQILKSWLDHSVGKVDWYIVHETLAGREIEREPDTLTELAMEVMRQTDWQSIVKGFEYRFEADEALRAWLQDQVDLWVQIAAIRGRKGSQLDRFCTSAYETCLAVIDWQSVYEDFLEEV